MNATGAIIAGLAALAGLWVVFGVASGFNPIKLICGADNTLSTSKFQFLLWTTIIVFSYVVMFAFHGRTSDFASLGFPENVLIIMGISATTAVAAKGIAVSNATAAAKALGAQVVPGSGPVLLPGSVQSLAGLFQSDDGTADLGKVQLIVWTLIGVGVYLTLLHHNLAYGERKLPEIDRTLMILMGLGHGAYLGKKIAGNGGS